MSQLEIRETLVFSEWLSGLRDMQARARIQARILRLQHGNAGDVKPIGEGVSEMRIDYGPGYRIYFVKRGALLIILLSGGTSALRTKTSGPRVSSRGTFEDFAHDTA